MADPLPYYRMLRDEHPVYYVPKWDTYALSRFADIWRVLEINDGTFVASEGTLPAATVLAAAQRRTGPDPPLHPMPFHANFDAPIYDERPALHVRPVPAEVGRHAGGPDPRAGQRAPRRTAAARHLRPDPGLRRHRRGLGGVRISRSASRSRRRRAGRPSTPGSLAQPGSGVEVANARPGLSGVPGPDRRAPRAPAGRRAGELPDRRQTARLPAARRFGADRHGSRHPDAGRVHRRHGDGAEDRRARTVGTGPPPRSDGRGACRSRRQRAGRPRGDDPLLRARAMVRPNRCASRSPFTTPRSTGPAHHHTARHRPTATSASTPNPTNSSGTGRSSACWRSAAGSTSASACTWPDWRSRSW